MKLEEVQTNSERKTVICSVRITKKQFDFMQDNDISLTLLVAKTFEELLEFWELMEKWKK